MHALACRFVAGAIVGLVGIAMSPATFGINTSDSKRIDGIDLLRGLAIFFVVMLHVTVRLRLAQVPYANGLSRETANLLFANGERGVHMFFAISGFLITSIALRRWESLSNVDVRDFYLLRFARIAPLLVLLLAVLSGLHFMSLHDFVVPVSRGGFGRALASALTFRLNVSEARHGYLPGNWDVLWSLSVEEMFYLFFPIVCRLLTRRKLFVALLFVFVALGPFGRTHGNDIWQDKSYLGGMDGIALGCLTAMLLSRVRLSRLVNCVVGGFGVAILIVTLGLSHYVNALGLGRNGLATTILDIGTCMVIAVSAQTRWRAPAMLRPLLKLGQYSYEIYLTHMFVVFALFDWFVAQGKQMRMVAPLFVAVMLVAGVFGALVARLYSESMNRIIRRRFLDQSGVPFPAKEPETRVEVVNEATA